MPSSANQSAWPSLAARQSTRTTFSKRDAAARICSFDAPSHGRRHANGEEHDPALPGRGDHGVEVLRSDGTVAAEVDHERRAGPAPLDPVDRRFRLPPPAAGRSRHRPPVDGPKASATAAAAPSATESPTTNTSVASAGSAPGGARPGPSSWSWSPPASCSSAPRLSSSTRAPPWRRSGRRWRPSSGGPRPRRSTAPGRGAGRRRARWCTRAAAQQFPPAGAGCGAGGRAAGWPPTCRDPAGRAPRSAGTRAPRGTG